MNTNPVFNSRPLARILLTLLLGAAAAAALWTMRGTVRGQILETKFSDVTIGKSGPPRAMGNISLGMGLNHAFSLNVAASSPASQLLNISTRLRVQPGDNTMIGGFIITGTQPKTVIVRGIGPSLSSFFPGVLADPVIEVHGSSGELLATNDNWNDAATRQQIIDSGLAPTNDLESALWGILNPGAYTVVVRGKNDTTGIGLFEVYDLDQTVDSKLANISTRGFVDTGDNVMIGGIIARSSGGGNATVIIRAIGPSLSAQAVSNTLPDPTLELHNGDGTLIALNDNWRSGQEQQVIDTTIPPPDDSEAAIVLALPPGNYTAIVRGQSNATGVALVEVYNIADTAFSDPVRVEASANIGPAGGTLEILDSSSALFGTRVSIPPGALSQSAIITIGSASVSPQLPPGFESRGPLAVLGPDGLTFSAPIAITMPSRLTDTHNDYISDLIYEYAASDFTLPPGTDPERESQTQSLDLLTKRITYSTNHFSARQPLGMTEVEAGVKSAGGLPPGTPKLVPVPYPATFVGVDPKDGVGYYTGCVRCQARTLPIDTIVVHSTNNPNSTLASEAARVQRELRQVHDRQREIFFTHFFIGTDGQILQFISEDVQTQHVGGFSNNGMIGIELMDGGLGNGTYTAKQQTALQLLVKRLMDNYNVPLANVRRLNIKILRGLPAQIPA